MEVLTPPFPTSTTPLGWMSGGTSRRGPPISMATAKPSSFPALQRQQISHSVPREKVEIFESLQPWIIQTVLPFIKTVDKSWQPSEFLPDPTRPESEFMDQIRALRKYTVDIPDEYFVVLVGDMITEEGLPTYFNLLDLCDVTRDNIAADNDERPWALWTRAWTAEENRHGDLLRTYLYLTGRVDMAMIEKTVQHLIRDGMKVGVETNPYLGTVYASFQERATFISHGNTARLAKEHGDPILANICGSIAADEKRHENVYVRLVEQLLQLDTNETMLAIANMVRKRITMPAHQMTDGRDPQLFKHFAYVAQRLKVYSGTDYIDNLEYMIQRWGLEKLEGLRDDGRSEQEFVCTLAPKLRTLMERDEARAKKPQKLQFSWIFDKEVVI